MTKPKVHKKPVVKPEDTQDQDQDAAAKSESSGLSKEQIAAKLGEKLDAAGVKDANRTGISGSVNAHPDDWRESVALLEQIRNRWPEALEAMVGLRVAPDRFADAFAFGGVKATLVFH